MTWLKIVSLIVFALALACGQILFKAAAQSLKGPIGFDTQTVFQLVTNPYLVLGLTVYGFATLYWVLLLRNIELSKELNLLLSNPTLHVEMPRQIEGLFRSLALQLGRFSKSLMSSYGTAYLGCGNLGGGSALCRHS
jgi:hypothetical protein